MNKLIKKCAQEILLKNPNAKCGEDNKEFMDLVQKKKEELDAAMVTSIESLLRYNEYLNEDQRFIVYIQPKDGGHIEEVLSSPMNDDNEITS